MFKVIAEYGYQTSCLILAAISLSSGLAATLYFPAKELSAGVKDEITNKRGTSIEETESSNQSNLRDIGTLVKGESSITHSENALQRFGRKEAIHDNCITAPKGIAPLNQAPTRQSMHSHPDVLNASGFCQNSEDTGRETPSYKQNCLNDMLRRVLSCNAIQAFSNPTFFVLVYALMGVRKAESFSLMWDLYTRKREYHMIRPV